MAGGIKDTLSSNFKNDENDDNEYARNDFVNARVEPEGNHPNMIKSSFKRDRSVSIY